MPFADFVESSAERHSLCPVPRLSWISAHQEQVRTRPEFGHGKGWSSVVSSGHLHILGLLSTQLKEECPEMARYSVPGAPAVKPTILSTIGYMSTVLGHLLAEVVPLLQLGTYTTRCKR